MQGIVLKIASEFCVVKCLDQTFVCKSKGILRHQKSRVITGDKVEFIQPEGQEQYGMIDKIYERTSELYRPQIANIDQVVIVSSVKDPNFDSYILNKYLTSVAALGIKKIVIFTKVDLINKNDNIFKLIKEYHKCGLTTFKINNIQPSSEEWEPFLESLKGKFSVFTGQTGAGKSTTLNNLLPNLFQKTQEISKALGRGKHTTTVNEMFQYQDGFIADTPGFSSFELKELSKNDIANNFLNFSNYSCKFRNCLHNVLDSSICGVVAAVQANEIPEFIYKDYQKLINEIESGRAR